MDRLHNTVRPYAWGSTTALPEFLGEEATGEPQAELWMGGHPLAPSRVDRGAGPAPLSDVIAADPAGELGDGPLDAFGPRLPFLLKVLGVHAPLSLQVHPDERQAREGFAREEAEGVPLEAAHRNYKDAHHKPELVCALTPFEGLCGFRPAAEAAQLLAGLGVDALKPYVDLLYARPEEGALREVLTAVLGADREQMAATVHHTAEAAGELAARGGEWAADYDCYARIAQHHPGDPGLVAAMLLHHVVLAPGEALHLDAGVPHAYVSGLGLEIMANSDNVLRCGLTPKHVDVPELLRIVRFTPGEPGVLRPEANGGGEEVYQTPTREFRLSRFALAPGSAPVDLRREAPQILLCGAGSVTLEGNGSRPGSEERLPLRRGESVYVPAGERVAARGDGTLFRATVPVGGD
ncbi:mannose-6-phosphate isomerase, class I [Streptomyces sp. NPDC005438]|uniref:mannose-6-phosphate isomerase, class I n=1 Tax=Streptomyces sp. NPDC005438 TaxID=3156880 RepID=UPI0033A9660D